MNNFELQNDNNSLNGQECNGLMETLYLNSIPEVKKQIIKGMSTPLSECLSEDEIEW